MSKKTKSKRAAHAPASPETKPVPASTDIALAELAPARHQLADLQTLAGEYLTGQQWDELVTLGSTPSQDIAGASPTDVEIWLLRVTIAGHTHNRTLAHHHLAPGARELVVQALGKLAQRAAPFHHWPEFELYLDTLDFEVESSAAGFAALHEACRDCPVIDWVLKLRDRALWLLRARDNESDEDALTHLQEDLLAGLGDLNAILGTIYEAAQQACNPEDEQNLLLLKTLRFELELRLAAPWDYSAICERVAQLPSPSEDDLVQLRAADNGSAEQEILTPRDWAFLWELSEASDKEYAALLARHPGPFGCSASIGLQLVVQSLVSAPDQVDELLSKGVQALMRFNDEAPDWFGSGLTLAPAQGARVLNLRTSSLSMPTIEDLLERLAERATSAYPRERELILLCQVFTHARQYDELDAEDEVGAPALDWLCEQSISFELAAARVLPQRLQRITGLLDAMCRCIESARPLPDYYYGGDLEGAALTPAEMLTVLEPLERLLALRAQMGPKVEKLWRRVVPGVFDALSPSVGDLQVRTLRLARGFRLDLLSAGAPFRLAYLEQRAGSAARALEYYLANLVDSKSVCSATLSNCKLLWSRSRNSAEVQGFVDELEGFVRDGVKATEARELLDDARSRLMALEKMDQFNKTAVNRWPDITGPARKLLGVLATVQSYSSFLELGGYANMDDTWAKRHYNKLVETGMLLVDDTGYRVNPFIAPLLARESQHAIVGRIVRSQGTSAVKQVFNSRREFSIYQVMVQLCPNHLVFPNSSLQSIMSFERMKELVTPDDFGYYLRASVDIVVVSSTTYLPMLAIEVDSIYHDTQRQQEKDDKKDRLFGVAGIPFMRLRPLGSPSENTIRCEVAEHLDELVRTLRADLPGFEQARVLLEDLSGLKAPALPLAL